jgi:hypothetical protein
MRLPADITPLGIPALGEAMVIIRLVDGGEVRHRTRLHLDQPTSERAWQERFRSAQKAVLWDVSGGYREVLREQVAEVTIQVVGATAGPRAPGPIAKWYFGPDEHSELDRG